jgi:hypothetical protein
MLGLEGIVSSAFRIAFDHPHQCADLPITRLLRARCERPSRRCAANQRDELAPSHELPSEKAHNLAHHKTTGTLCTAAKYTCLCRFRVIFTLRPMKREPAAGPLLIQ